MDGTFEDFDIGGECEGPPQDYWVVLMQTIPGDSTGDIEIGRIAGLNARDTHEWIACQILAASFGFTIHEVEDRILAAYRRSHAEQAGKSRTYDEAHDGIWHRLRRRGKLLADRRRERNK